MAKLLIIQGFSGTGKTTVSRLLAKKLKYSILEEDNFLFGMNYFRPLKKKENDIAQLNLYSCFNNYAKKNFNLILEGALVSFDRRVNTFDLNQFIAHAKQKKYVVIHILLTAKKSVCYQRMKKRKIVVPLDLYNNLKSKIKLWFSSADAIIDTSYQTPQQTLAVIEQVLKKR